jgi:hypothetical protein
LTTQKFRQYEIPEKVTLKIINNEEAQAFLRRCLMEAARLAGLPLLEQTSFADYFISLGSTIIWKEKDPTPNDSIVIKNDEIKNRHDSDFNYWLSDFQVDELKQRQIYYQLNGGVLGSNLEIVSSETIVVDLNIVYDPNLITYNNPQQTKLEYIQQNLKPKLNYWTETLSKINLDYTIRYTSGTVDQERIDITSGRTEGMVNIFYSNDPKSLWAYAKTEPFSQNIFISELKKDFMYDRTLCHEIGHLFGITGMSGIYSFDKYYVISRIPNLISDAKINSALNQLSSNETVKGIDWIDDYRKVPRYFYHTPQIAKLGINATKRVIQREPTVLDIYRYGARMLKK